ncbi:MAG: transposase, partial [Phycisphaerae bacterium]|nr:transposase [Phycisphaerae bacterium]
LDQIINQNVRVFKIHNPYFESDHVLNIAYNILCQGDCLEDIERLRNDEAYLDALGAVRIPDPTTAGDFCRRFDTDQIKHLQDAINQARVKVWKQQDPSFFKQAIIDGDGTIAPTTGECKQGMDISYKGTWGYHALVISLANTQEPLFVVNRSGNQTSSSGAAAYFNQAAALCQQGGFESIRFRGDTDFSQTAYLDDWDGRKILFNFGIAAMPNLVKLVNTDEKDKY